MAGKKTEAQLAHCIYYHDPDKKGETYAGIFWYWMSPKGAFLTNNGPQPLNNLAKTKAGPVVPGNYQHFKGGYYHVVDCLELQGTGVFYVIYFPQKPGESTRWYYREAQEFVELVKIGKTKTKKPRFRQI